LNTSKLNFIDSAQSKSFAALTKPWPGSPSSRPSNPLVLFADWWELRSDWWNNSVSTLFPRLALILFSSVDGNKNDRGKVVVLHLFLCDLHQFLYNFGACILKVWSCIFLLVDATKIFSGTLRNAFFNFSKLAAYIKKQVCWFWPCMHQCGQSSSDISGRK